MYLGIAKKRARARYDNYRHRGRDHPERSEEKEGGGEGGGGEREGALTNNNLVFHCLRGPQFCAPAGRGDEGKKRRGRGDLFDQFIFLGLADPFLISIGMVGWRVDPPEREIKRKRGEIADNLIDPRLTSEVIAPAEDDQKEGNEGEGGGRKKKILNAFCVHLRNHGVSVPGKKKKKRGSTRSASCGSPSPARSPRGGREKGRRKEFGYYFALPDTKEPGSFSWRGEGEGEKGRARSAALIADAFHPAEERKKKECRRPGALHRDLALFHL